MTIKFSDEIFDPDTSNILNDSRILQNEAKKEIFDVIITPKEEQTVDEVGFDWKIDSFTQKEMTL